MITREAFICWKDKPWTAEAMTFGIDVPEDEQEGDLDDSIFFYISSEDFKKDFDGGDFTILRTIGLKEEHGK